MAPQKGKLRPTAPTFQPKPTPIQAQASGSGSGTGQRIHAPPGGNGNGLWDVDKRPKRSEWEAKKLANGYPVDRDRKEEGDDWFGEGRGQSNRQLWDEA